MRILSLCLLAALCAFQPAEVSELKPAGILYCTTDAGASWRDISTGLPDDLQASCVSASSTEVFLGTGNGLLYHRLYNGSWEQEYVGGAILAHQIDNIRGIFTGTTGLYVSGSRGGFFRQIPGTNFWSPMHQTLADKTVNAIVETPERALLVACPSGIYVSTDGGGSWKHTYQRGQVTSLALSGKVLIANSPQGLIRSVDKGQHWTCVLAEERAWYKIIQIGQQVAAIRTGDQLNPSAGNAPQRALVSADGGITWKQIDKSLPQGQVMYDLKQVGTYLFCSYSSGISRSADGGKTWEQVHQFTNPTPYTNYQLIISGKTVYAMKMQAGC